VRAPAVPSSFETDKEIAGLSKSSRAEVLTWERVYALALVRFRSSGKTVAESLDPAVLRAAADRQEVANFARFRVDFLAGSPGTGGFQDPSASVLALHHRLQMVDNARQDVAYHDSLTELLRERVQGESSGLSQLDLDVVNSLSLLARERLADEIRKFRDGFDELKAALGLSPRAAVLLDRTYRAAFGAVFKSVDDWCRLPTRHLAELPRLIDQLPPPGDVVIDGQPILARIENKPDQWEDVLTAATRLAIKNRVGRDKDQKSGGAAAELELRIRRRIRSLFETRRGYDAAKRSYELAVRLWDQGFERLMAPAQPGPRSSRSTLFAGLTEQYAQVLKNEGRLVALWTSFRGERLALYHELGVLPYNNWNAYYADLAVGPGGGAPGPAAPPGAEAAAPEPRPRAPVVPQGQ
jgi:hypothetical protein